MNDPFGVTDRYRLTSRGAADEQPDNDEHRCARTSHVLLRCRSIKKHAHDTAAIGTLERGDDGELLASPKSRAQS
jgi:hypothetical protein